MTTEPAQLLPAQLLNLLVPIEVHHKNNNQALLIANEVCYIIPLSPALPHIATKADLYYKNQQLWHTIHLAEVELEKDFIQMKLMDSENRCLHKQVYAKQSKKAEKKEMTQAHACLMTAAKNLDALAKKDFMKYWKEVMKHQQLLAFLPPSSLCLPPSEVPLANLPPLLALLSEHKSASLPP